MPLSGACPSYVMANAGGKGYYLPDYRGDLLARLAANRAALSIPEYTSVLYDLRALVRAGSVDAATALDWVRAAAGSSRTERDDCSDRARKLRARYAGCRR